MSTVLQKLPRDQQPCYIYKAPDHIRSTNQKQYEPVAVAIGPYHAGSGVAALQKAQKLKEQCLNEVLLLSGRKHGDYLKEMRSLVKKARGYYAEGIDMDNEEMAQMLLLDGCFILVSLHGTGGIKQLPPANGDLEWSHSTCPQESDEENQITEANGIDSWNHFYIARDLFLLENQIPFLVIQKIYELLIEDHPSAERRAVDSMVAYVRQVLAVYVKVPKGEAPPAGDVHHLLHLCHMHLIPIQQRSTSSVELRSRASATVGRLRRATQYRELMVRFRKRELGKTARSILDVRFRGGVLEIPPLEIDGGTLRFMANLILLEQGSPHVGLYITAYCAFMSQIAGTAEDVALLSEKGIIVHTLGSDGDVAEGFRKLCDGIIFDANDDRYNYLRPLCQALEEHYRSGKWRLLSSLRRHANCPNPWILVGILGIIALLCFITQQLHHATLTYQGA